MKATLDIDNAVMRRLEEEAARRNTSTSSLVEAALLLILERDAAPPAEPVELSPLPSWDGGEPWVDVADRATLSALIGDDGPRRDAEA